MTAAAALLLSGCAQLHPAPNESIVTGRFSGRISFGGKTENASGRYRLSQMPKERVLDVLTPLSGLLARVRTTSNETTLEKGGDIIARAPTSDALMAQTFGFSLSIPTLSAWLSGRPDPALPFDVRNADSFIQENWIVQVKRRHPSGAPAVISAVRSETATAPGVLLTLTIEENS